MTTAAMPLMQAISKENKRYIPYFNERLGHVPHLYLAMMQSAHAFENFYHFRGRKTTLSVGEREAISLVMAQLNESRYCLSAHTMIAKLNGFSDDEIMQLRNGKANFNAKLHALVCLVKAITAHKGKQVTSELTAFFHAHYTNEHLMDMLQAIGENYISNLMAKTLEVPLDFPEAPPFEKDDRDEND